MSLHDVDLNRRLTDYLDRRTPPRTLASNDRAKSDQISAYLRIVRKYAPDTEDLHEWWGRFTEALSEAAETWAWPSEKEVWNACKAAAKSDPNKQANAWHVDSVAVNLVRIREQKPVGTDWLWGTGAHQLVAAGADRGEMRERRMMAAQRMCEVYGPEVAREKLLALKAKHEAAADRIDAQQRRQVDVSIPDKRVFSRDELEGLVA